LKNIWRTFFASVLVCLLSREAGSSTISAVTVPLAKAVADSRLIVVGSVEKISEYRFSNARKKAAATRYFEVRIEEVLKSRDSATKHWSGRTIPVLDPQEMFYQEQADLIAAEVISFVDPQYPTKVTQIAAGDRLIFFLAGPETAREIPLPDARFLICGRAYDTLAIKRAVLKQLK
jgi:Trk K+ transport system NAD-binding subunit